MIEAKVLADTINPDGNRLTTFVLRYHRFIHGEVLTHRALSRNSASSRAIPINTMIRQVVDDPAIPVKWGRQQKGMQSGDEVENVDECLREWLGLRDKAVETAYRLRDLNLHKNRVNRILEPWQYQVTICSGTSWENFFTLRWHEDAEAEFQELADKMRLAYLSSDPEYCDWGDWHLPFIGDKDRSQHNIESLVKISTSRCARVSYLKHDGQHATLDEELVLHDRLVGSDPKHASPAEHPAQAIAGQWANFTGFRQYRRLIPNECATTFPWS